MISLYSFDLSHITVDQILKCAEVLNIPLPRTQDKSQIITFLDHYFQSLYNKEASYLEQLPTDILIQILINLPIKDLISLCQTNQKIHQVCLLDRLWTGRLRQEYPEFPIPPQVNLRNFYFRLLWLQSRAKIFRITAKDILQNTHFKNVNTFVRAINTRTPLLTRLKTQGVKRGDILLIISINRVTFVFIYDGSQWQRNTTLILTIPPQFPVIDELSYSIYYCFI